MKSVLMVAEKPSLAASLAIILSDGQSIGRKIGNCQVHEWCGLFHNESVKFKMTSVCGHVMSLDFTSKYNHWEKVDPVELFSCPTEKKEANPKLKMPYFLSQEARNCDYLILWLDCDKEGENICFEVINAVKGSMKRNPSNADVTYRARFSAITEKEIKSAMMNLVAPNENEARSVDARQELDLRIGCAFTRFQTHFFNRKYGNLDSSLISYGPCQTPTLGFCVQKHDEIQTFKPEQFWILHVVVRSSDQKEVTLEWARSRCFEKDIAQLFLQRVKANTIAKVIDISSKSKVNNRPLALNTVELMRIGSSCLGMAPHHVMQVAEKLYTQGYISYPRTETTHYANSFDLNETVRLLHRCSEWLPEIRQLIQEGISHPRKGRDAGDHPPITPMKSASREDFDQDHWRIYEYIMRHFIATVSKDCKYLDKVVTLTIGKEIFTTREKTVTDPGFTKVMHWQEISKNDSTLTFSEGEECPIVDAKLVESQTSPPDYLTEAELITLMEKHGIGTDASIPVHINNICQRNYVTVSSGRRLIPTPLGIVLVHGYQKIDPELVLPTMRSAVEVQLNLIAQGHADFNAVLYHTVEIFKLKFLYFVKNIEGMDQLFEVSFSPLATSGKALSRCGKCRRYMKHIQTKPSRLHCNHCDETYNLPQNGNVRIYKELKCPLDDFELLSWSAGSKGKSYPLCPYCYNHPPFPDMKKGSGCNSCTHPNCPQALNNTGVSSCLECDGVLVLDSSSGPKWKLGCNRCDVIIHIFEDAHKIQPTPETCSCGAQLVTVEYKPERSKLLNEATEMTDCLFCCNDFAPLVEKHRAVASRPAVCKPRNRGRPKPKGKPRPAKDKMAQLDSYFV